MDSLEFAEANAVHTGYSSSKRVGFAEFTEVDCARSLLTLPSACRSMYLPMCLEQTVGGAYVSKSVAFVEFTEVYVPVVRYSFVPRALS